MKKKINIAPIQFTNFEGVRYTIYFRKITKKDLEGTKARAADGVCFAPNSKHPKIIIDPNLKDVKLLKILIHEIFHSFLWDKNEKEVRLFAKTLAEIIYFLGWRKEDKDLKHKKNEKQKKKK